MEEAFKPLPFFLISFLQKIMNVDEAYQKDV